MRGAIVLVVLAGTVQAAQLKELVATALARNPEILAAQKRYEAARQRPAQESSLPDPRLSFGYASNGGPLPFQGLGSQPTSNIGVTISQEIPYPGKLKLRGDIAAKEAGAEFQQYLAIQLNVRSRVIQAYHMLHHTYASVEILTEGKELMSRALRVSEARYAAGKAAQQDIFKAQTQLSILETRIVQMLQDRRTAEAQLNALLNRAPGSAVAVPEDSEAVPLSLTVDELLSKAAETAPDLGRGRTMIERSELAVSLAKKEFHTDYTVSAGYYNMGSMPAMYEARVEIPLHLHTSARQRPALNEQVQLLSEARHNFEAAEQNLQYRVREQYAAAETAYRLMKLYEDTILPQSALTIEASLTAYGTGASDFLGVLSNIGTRVDAQEQLHEQELNYAIAVAKLEELTGVAL
ncbi:MAG TPA: TolC family protein [Candidatus Sulfopaludibacter sp.]|jgi:outer membrane protein TolC|nr:TolC family protein [Candidatus Sulfopaludibacter sp.]